jgi:hypothetical protein
LFPFLLFFFFSFLYSVACFCDRTYLDLRGKAPEHALPRMIMMVLSSAVARCRVLTES